MDRTRIFLARTDVKVLKSRQCTEKCTEKRTICCTQTIAISFKEKKVSYRKLCHPLNLEISWAGMCYNSKTGRELIHLMPISAHKTTRKCILNTVWLFFCILNHRERMQFYSLQLLLRFVRARAHSTFGILHRAVLIFRPTKVLENLQQIALQMAK